MSLLSPERLHVAIRPDGIALFVSRGFPRRIVRHAAWTSDPAAPGDAPWDPVVETLRARLAAYPCAARSVNVTLSNHFCRYALFRDTAALTRPSELLAFAQHKMRSAFGDRSEHWDLRVQREKDTLIACAAPRALTARLVELFAERRLRVLSLQPYFAALFDRYRTRVGQQSGWFVVQENERVVLGRFARGRWSALVSRRTSDDSAEALIAVLDRECLLQGREEAETVWLASTVRRYAPAELAQYGYRVNVLPPGPFEGQSTESELAYAMAA